MADTNRIVIASDVRVYRDSLCSALQRIADFEVVAAVDAAGAVLAARRILADVVLLDLGAPRRFEVLQALAAIPGPPVVVLALEDSGTEVLACIEAGARGYVTRAGSLDDLVATVRSVARGEMLCSPRIAAMMVRRLATLASVHSAAVYSPLTNREREIVRLLDRGLANKAIAHALGIEIATVKNHIHHILEKLHVHRRADAVMCLRRTGAPGASRGAGPREAR